MPIREPADFVFSGSGTRIPCHLGAFDRLVRRFATARVGGVSGGGVLALAVAAGLDMGQLAELCRSVLCRNDLLDRSLWPLDGFGVYRGQRIFELLRDVFGPARMRDLQCPCRIVVCDLWTRQTVVVDSEKDGDVLVADVARCTMAIPGFFKAWRLRADNARTYVDGGTGANFPMDLFDDVPLRPTIGVTFAPTSEEPRPCRTLASFAAALFDIRQDASNGCRPSRKPSSGVVVVNTKADGLKFNLSPEEIEQRVHDGWSAADRWLATQR